MTDALTTLAQIDLEYREIKTTAERRAREAAQKEIEGAYIRRLQAVHAAHEAGFSKRRIALEGLHTKDTATTYRLLKEGEPYVRAAASGGEAAEFRLGTADSTVIITPKRGDLATVLGALNLTAAHLDENPALTEATFSFDAENERLKPMTPAFVPGVGRHPVIALVMAPASPLGRRAVEWAKAALAA